MIEVIGLDGDDTLWHSENHFAEAHDTFAGVLAPYSGEGLDVVAHQYATERRNLELFGYGIKGFTLSMIETAIEVTDGRITAAEISALLDVGKKMLAHPVNLLDGVADTVAELAEDYRLVVVTKGDLFHQEQKVARSGLADLFERIEIVSEKDEATYLRVVRAMGAEPTSFLMVGNSVRSDVLPVLAIGGHAVQVPYVLTWGHEVVEDHGASFPVLARLADLPARLPELG